MAFPNVAPVRAVLGVEVLPDGTRRKRLASDDGRCYEFLRTLGPALMGEVKLAVECERDAAGVWSPSAPPRCVAVKRIFKWCIQQGVTLAPPHRRVLENPFYEFRVQAFLSRPGHANITRLRCVLEDDECLFIVQDFCDGGELFNQLAAHGGSVPEGEARAYMWGMVQGAAYMHGLRVAHRDLSLENAMLATDPAAAAGDAGGGDGDGRGGAAHSGAATVTRQPRAPAQVPKLIDFGLSAALPAPGGAPLLPPCNPPVGKTRYMPPEMHAMEAYDGAKVDCWCLGVCLFVLLFGVYPYEHASPRLCQYFRALAQPQGLSHLLNAWGFASRASPQALDLLVSMLTVDAAARPTLAGVAAHPWFDAVRGGSGGGGGAAACAAAGGGGNGRGGGSSGSGGGGGEVSL